MKSKYNLNVFLIFLFLITVVSSSRSAVKVDVKENTVKTKTDQKGIEGLKGCKKERIKPKSAYIYDLFRKVDSKSNPPTCNSSNKSNRYKHSKRVVTNSEEGVEFKNLKPGIYKIVAYYATPTGCDISKIVDAKMLDDYPSSSIIYQKEESEEFKITSLLKLTETISNNQIKKFEVFPNPSSDKVYVAVEGIELNKDTELYVQSIVGGEVERYQLPANQSQINYEIDLSRYSAGTYLVYLSDKNGIQYKRKIVVLKN